MKFFDTSINIDKCFINNHINKKIFTYHLKKLVFNVYFSKKRKKRIKN